MTLLGDSNEFSQSAQHENRANDQNLREKRNIEKKERTPLDKIEKKAIIQSNF